MRLGVIDMKKNVSGFLFEFFFCLCIALAVGILFGFVPHGFFGFLKFLFLTLFIRFVLGWIAVRIYFAFAKNRIKED
jgi:hypothetical protein